MSTPTASSATEPHIITSRSRNPYRAKNPWPPDFSTLNPRHQFRLERRYKRRAQLKWARPRLMAFTRLAQWGAGVSVLVYGVFFYGWNGDQGAFSGARQWYKETVGSAMATRGGGGQRRKKPDDT